MCVAANGRVDGKMREQRASIGIQLEERFANRFRDRDESRKVMVCCAGGVAKATAVAHSLFLSIRRRYHAINLRARKRITKSMTS